MKETRFNIGMNTLKQIDGLHGEEVYNTIQEISPAIADLLVELFGDIYTRTGLDLPDRNDALEPWEQAWQDFVREGLDA